MKILFLDFDGVLNNRKFFSDLKNHENPRYSLFDERNDFDPKNIKTLARILTQVPECSVVVSSAWRIGRDVSKLKELLSDLGPLVERVIDKTPDLSEESYERGYEIDRWLKDNPGVTSFVILDDDADMVHLSHRHIKTSWGTGLTEEQALLAIEMLTK